jgi:hypothetical protein
MTNILKISISIIIIFFLNAMSAEGQKCATSVRDSLAIAEDPTYLKMRTERINAIQRSASQKTTIGDEIIYIPTVIHVIHKSEDGSISDDPKLGNISNEQIESQMKVLNEDFRRLEGTAGFNNLIDGADMQLVFCLAKRDPNGNETNGITRHYYEKSSFDARRDDREIKSIVKWPQDDYLNIYVVPELKDDFLGYSTFPEDDRDWDGVVMANKFFGYEIGTTVFGFPYNEGRTLTHELGHWLGLLHIWGDGGCGVDDGCEDTPESDASNYGCDTLHESCLTIDMVRNYMDYSDDYCFNIFTRCQKQLARGIFEKGTPFNRNDILLANALGNISCSDLDSTVRVSDSQIKIGTIDASRAEYSIFNLSTNTEYNVKLFDSRGRKISSFSETSNASGILNLEFNQFRQGIYTLELEFENGSSKKFKIFGPLK